MFLHLICTTTTKTVKSYDPINPNVKKWLILYDMLWSVNVKTNMILWHRILFAWLYNIICTSFSDLLQSLSQICLVWKVFWNSRFIYFFWFADILWTLIPSFIPLLIEPKELFFPPSISLLMLEVRRFFYKFSNRYRNVDMLWKHVWESSWSLSRSYLCSELLRLLWIETISNLFLSWSSNILSSKFLTGEHRTSFSSP